MRYPVAFALLVLTLYAVVGCHPARGAEPLPQSTLALPQSTLTMNQPCPCPNGGPCSCVGECKCPGCKCAACPAKEGVCDSYESALASARQYHCGLVAFVGLPARSVRGAVSYHLDAATNPQPRIRAGTADVGQWLPADATNAQIMVACHPGQVVVGHEKVCDDNGCKLLPIFGPAPVTYGMNALAPPPMYYAQPQYTSYGGGN